MKKKQYTKEFKQQAVDLADSLGSTAEASRQLGVSNGSIYSWRLREVVNGTQNQAAVGPNEAEELKRLRYENAQLKKVNHILKAAAAFFSQDHLK